MDELLNILGLLIATGVGMGCGSYATMPYYRLPKGIPCAGKWVGEKSACPSCGKQLRTRDLVPVLNWLWTKGQCYNCQALVNPVYFFIEVACTVLSVLLYLRFGFDQMYILTLGLSVCLVIVTATQYSYQVVPNAVLIVVVMFGFLYRTILDGNIYDMVFSFTIAVMVGLLFTKIYNWMTGKEIINYGLLKLFAISGIWLSPAQLSFQLLLMGIFSVIVIFLVRMFGRSFTLLLGGVLSLPLLTILYFPSIHKQFINAMLFGGI